MPHRPASARVVGAVVVVLVGAVGALLARRPGRPIDLEVYRTAGAVWRAGQPLYRDGYPHGLGVYLPFTYPPFAALVLGATALLPSPVAVALASAASLLALGLTARLAARTVGLTRPGADVTPVVAAGLAVLAMALEPVRWTLTFGQVNLVLMAMVAADVLVRRTRWPRGLLIGLAAAVKLTPLAFLLVLVCRRQWRACATAAAAFVGAHLLAAVALPDDSRDYWLGGVLTDPSRIGSPGTAGNQSLRGALGRVWPDAPAASWLALVALVGVLTVVATWRRTRQGDDLGALLATAAGGLLVSPVSWSHHWVWAVPALLWLGARAVGDARGSRGPNRWVTAAVALVFVVGPHRLLPAGGREPQWAWWEHVVGDAYVEVALAALVAASVTGRPSVRRRRRTTGAATTTSAPSAQAPDASPGTVSPR